MESHVGSLFRLDGRVVIITGGAGLLGYKHAEAVIESGGIPVLLDIDRIAAENCAAKLLSSQGGVALGVGCDITSEESVKWCAERVQKEFNRIDVLINNASNNPKFEAMTSGSRDRSRLENFPVSHWNDDIAVGLTGAFLCSRVFGARMASAGRGVILNIASDLSVIAPDQRLYRNPGVDPDDQPVKPITYSVVKHGLIGLTRYLATYWADSGIRVNALSPGGVFTGQDEAFVTRLTNLIPLKRMATRDEYKAAVIFLISDASAYLHGQNIVMDGGRSVW